MNCGNITLYIYDKEENKATPIAVPDVKVGLAPKVIKAAVEEYEYIQKLNAERGVKVDVTLQIQKLINSMGCFGMSSEIELRYHKGNEIYLVMFSPSGSHTFIKKEASKITGYWSGIKSLFNKKEGK